MISRRKSIEILFELLVLWQLRGDEVESVSREKSRWETRALEAEDKLRQKESQLEEEQDLRARYQPLEKEVQRLKEMVEVKLLILHLLQYLEIYSIRFSVTSWLIRLGVLLVKLAKCVECAHCGPLHSAQWAHLVEWCQWFSSVRSLSLNPCVNWKFSLWYFKLIAIGIPFYFRLIGYFSYMNIVFAFSPVMSLLIVMLPVLLHGKSLEKGQCLFYVFECLAVVSTFLYFEIALRSCWNTIYSDKLSSIGEP